MSAYKQAELITARGHVVNAWWLTNKDSTKIQRVRLLLLELEDTLLSGAITQRRRHLFGAHKVLGIPGILKELASCVAKDI